MDDQCLTQHYLYYTLYSKKFASLIYALFNATPFGVLLAVSVGIRAGPKGLNI